jgi:hypothetical protein
VLLEVGLLAARAALEVVAQIAALLVLETPQSHLHLKEVMVVLETLTEVVVVVGRVLLVATPLEIMVAMVALVQRPQFQVHLCLTLVVVAVEASTMQRAAQAALVVAATAKVITLTAIPEPQILVVAVVAQAVWQPVTGPQQAAQAAQASSSSSM